MNQNQIPNNEVEEFIGQLLYTSSDESLKSVIRNDYESLKKVLELFDEWKATRGIWVDDDFLRDPPGCFQS